MEDNLRQRASKRLLRVTLPSGEVICYNNATETFIETLQKIGSENFDKIKTTNCHLPILSKEIYPKYKDWMKPVCDGWYLNALSDTGQKYMQLISIKEQLGLDMEIEMGTGFITRNSPSQKKVNQPSPRNAKKLLVKFPDGEYVGGTNPLNTLLDTVWKIGIDELQRKEIEYGDKPIITYTQQFKEQVQVGKDRWLYVPSLTTDKCRMLRLISSTMRLGLEVTMI